MSARVRCDGLVITEWCQSTVDGASGDHVAGVPYTWLRLKQGNTVYVYCSWECLNTNPSSPGEFQEVAKRLARGAAT